MTADYILINNQTGEMHELDFENVADIQAALRGIKSFNERRWPYDESATRKKIFTAECFEVTCKKISKVTVPATDY